jgi:hypothetical protein
LQKHRQEKESKAAAVLPVLQGFGPLLGIPMGSSGSSPLDLLRTVSSTMSSLGSALPFASSLGLSDLLKKATCPICRTEIDSVVDILE